MSLAYKISGWNRHRKWGLFLKHFIPLPHTTILDVGFNEVEYSDNDNFLEKNYPYKDRITALGIGGNDEFKKRYPEVKSVVYSGGVFPFKDKAFDVGWSNAVLEHVGTREAQILFLKEMKRVTNRAFITTPNKLFPIEVHTRIPLLHIVLPKKWFDYVVRLVGKGWASGNYMHLITLKRLREYLKEAGITEYTIIKNRIGFFTLDFVIIF